MVIGYKIIHSLKKEKPYVSKETYGFGAPQRIRIPDLLIPSVRPVGQSNHARKTKQIPRIPQITR